MTMVRSRAWTGIALGAVVAALALRLYDLDLRSVSHPEVYVPGIPLPPIHSVPPPRLNWSETLSMHFHDEPHPMGWYLAMFLWTGLAGVSEWALRLPSAVLGAASVWLAFVLGRRAYGAPAGALAASLLALHGFHLFLSQSARMYAAGAFFGLLSTALLLAFVYGSGRRGLTGAGYVLSVVATAGSVEFVWPLLGIQIVWATLALPMQPFRWGDLVRARFSGVHPAIQLQAVAVMLSAPELLHSVYRARHGAVEQAAPEFLREYLTFGFLFATDRNAMPALAIPMAAAVALLVAGLGLVAWGCVTRARQPSPAGGGENLPRWFPPGLALVVSGFMVWLARIALHRNEALMVVSAGPILALWLPAAAQALGHGLSRSALFVRWRAQTAGPRLLVILLGLVAPLVLFVLSAKVAILASRAFLIFVPYLVILVAGAAAGIGARLPRLGATVALIGAFAASVPYSFAKPGSPRDYKSVVAAMMPYYRPDDLILVLDKSWTEAPLYYYLPEARYVFADYEAALQGNPDARVWLVTWPFEDMPVVNDDRRQALAAYRREQHVEALRASAELFLPPGYGG
ncbi:MAG: glycosyltransferase family 39 protein [Albidovulum sp.]